MTRIALALALIAAAVPALAQSVARPRVKAGDAWTYQRIERVPEQRSSVLLMQVVAVDERAVHLIQTDQRGEKERDIVMTPDWNLVSSPSGGAYTPHNGALRFPMAPGDSWSSKYKRKEPEDDGERLYERSSTVVGWERVHVPAGNFRALKVTVEGKTVSGGQRRGSRNREVFWYVPEVKRFVKWTYEVESPRRGVIRAYEYQLLEYQLL